MLSIFDLADRRSAIELLPDWDKLDTDSFFEPKMRARVVSAVETPSSTAADPIYKVSLDVSEFEDYNRPFEVCDWRKGNDIVTFREAHKYEPVMPVIICFKDLQGYVKLLDETSAKFMDEWKAEKSGKHYAEWLETQLFHARLKLDLILPA